MNRALAVFAASVVTLAGSAAPQHPLQDPPRIPADTARDWWSSPLLPPLPADTRSALVAVPGSSELVLAEPAGLGLAFRSTPDFHGLAGGGEGLRPCGRWDTWMPGSFTHRAFVGGDILIAMQTGNACPEVTLVRVRGREPAGELGAVEVRRIRSIAYERPWPAPERRTMLAMAADVVDWDSTERSALVAFYDPMSKSEGVVIARVALSTTSATPAFEPSTPIDGEFLGLGTDCRSIRIDGRLHLFTRRPAADRLAPVEVHVRGEDGWTLAQDGRLEGLRAEPEYAVWADAAGRVHLTTPRSTPVETDAARLGSNPDSIQTFVTYRRVETLAGPTWQLVPVWIAWTGRMRLGPQLTVIGTDSDAPALAFRTADGEIVVLPFDD